MWDKIFLLGLFVFCVCRFLSSYYNYWEKRGVPSPSASLLFGNFGAAVTLSKSIQQCYNDVYNEFPDVLYAGYYKMQTPAIALRDPELIKEVLVKQFSSFHDNDFMLDEKDDPIGGKNPLVLKGNKWKMVKSKVTPAFTLKKLKSMTVFMNESANKMVKYIEKKYKSCNVNGMDSKELCARYAIDVLASCVFGIDGKSFEDEDPEFRRVVKKIFGGTTTTAIRMVLLFVFPSLGRFFKIKLIKDKVANYFGKIINETLEYRRLHQIVSNDFLGYMLELKSKLGEHVWTNEDVLAQTLGFFTDGFETSSSLMSHVLFHLGQNPNIQELLYREIKEVIARYNKNLDYDIINEMPYLDAVICETLRMNPPGMILLRVCTKPFTFPSPRGHGMGPDVLIEVGTPVIVPVYGLQHDSKYYDNPEVFDPNRFFKSAKDNITKFTYLPFGEGPRNCHGQRFAVLLNKVGIIRIVKNFKIGVNNRTITPLQIDPKYLTPQAKGGIWLNLRKRENEDV